MPLLDSNLHSELTEALKVVNKLLQCLVALSVKFAVLEELIHRFLLAAFEHLL